MSNWCQFCDEEMYFEQSVVYKRGYITCGKQYCVDQATKIADEILKESHMLSEDILIFSSETPDNNESWRGVLQEDYPDCLFDEDIIEKMLEGCSICPYDDEVHYIAMKCKDYKDALQFYVSIK